MEAKNLKVGDQVTQHFLILESSVNKAKNGKDYVSFDCRAEDGTMFTGCKIWDCDVAPEGVCLITGKMEEFNSNKQIVAKIVTVNTELSPDIFQPQCPLPMDVEYLRNELAFHIGSIINDSLREFTKGFLGFWSTHTFPGGAECEPRFSRHPGGMRVHHAYRHGLLQHTVEVIQHAVSAGAIHKINTHERDLLIAGCAIHDIGKLESSAVVNGVYEYTAYGRIYGWSSNAHLYIGAQMLSVYCALQEAWMSQSEFAMLSNIMLSHHGPHGDVKPKSVVSQMVHLADMVSSNLNRMNCGLAGTEEDDIKRDIARESYIRIPDYEEIKDEDEPGVNEDYGAEDDSARAMFGTVSGLYDS